MITREGATELEAIPTPPDEDGAARYGLLLVTLLVWFGFTAYALWRGQDAGWDQFNYHFALPDALLHFSYWRNIAPSQMQSWLNPLGYVPAYWLALHADAKTVAVLLALLQALNAPLLYLIGLRVRGATDRRTALEAGIAALIGVTAATFLGEVGTTLLDIVSALFVYGGLLLALAGMEGRSAADIRRQVFAGALIGAVVGLKLVNGVYALALPAAIALVIAPPRRLAFLLRFAVGGIAGFLLTAGWWCALLWSQYGNPIFPYFNAFFHSPWLDGVPHWIGTGSGADVRFIPASLGEAIGYPVRWAVNGIGTSSEYVFRDARPIIAILLGVAIGGPALWRKAARHPDGAGFAPGEAVLLLFCGLSFILWMGTFAIQRYILPIEGLSGLLIAIGLRRLIASPAAAIAALSGLGAILIGWTRPPDFGHIPWQRSLIAQGLAPLYAPGILYVMVGSEANAFVIPAMPRDARFVRIDGNMPLTPGRGLGRIVATAIAAQTGAIATIGRGPLQDDDLARLARWGLASAGSCRTVTTLGAQVTSCRLRRVSGAAA